MNEERGRERKEGRDREGSYYSVTAIYGNLANVCRLYRTVLYTIFHTRPSVEIVCHLSNVDHTNKNFSIKKFVVCANLFESNTDFSVSFD